MQIEDISSLNEREQCYEYTDGLKWAADEDVEVNTLEDQVDRLKELKENMKLFNWMKIKKKKFSLYSWCFNLFSYYLSYFPSVSIYHYLEQNNPEKIRDVEHFMQYSVYKM